MVDNGYPALGDIQPSLIRQHPYGLGHLIPVVQRFPHPHENDILHRMPQYNAGQKHLGHDFSGTKLPNQPHLPGNAKPTSHAAPDLT